MKVIPNYHPPADYRRPTKTQEKVYVPVNDYPEINFSMITNPLTLLLAFSYVFCSIPLMYTAPSGSSRAGTLPDRRTTSSSLTCFY